MDERTVGTYLISEQLRFTSHNRHGRPVSEGSESPFKAGTYIFSNFQSHSTVRSYKRDETIFVSSTREFPGAFEMWAVTVVTGGYTIKNVGLDAFCKADAAPGKPVITDDAFTVFEISRADEESYVIKIANADLVWTAGPPVIPRGEIILEGAQGLDTQKFRLVVVGP